MRRTPVLLSLWSRLQCCYRANSWWSRGSSFSSVNSEASSWWTQVISSSIAIMPKKKFYAVRAGRETGIFESWNECESQVKGYPKCEYKSFETVEQAKEYLSQPSYHQSRTKQQQNEPRLESSMSMPSINTSGNAKRQKMDHIVLPPPVTSASLPSVTASSVTFAPPFLGSSLFRSMKTLSSPARAASNPTSTTKTTTTTTTESVQATSSLTSPPATKRTTAKRQSEEVESTTAEIPSTNKTITIWTDGACPSNGQAGAKAGVGVFFGDDSELNVSEPLPEDLSPMTNQRAELYAAVRALDVVLEKLCDNFDSVQIYTDSAYVIGWVNSWWKSWEANGWRKLGKAPANLDLIKLLLSNIRAVRSKNITVKFTHVLGHAGNYGNEQADRLAVNGCRL